MNTNTKIEWTDVTWSPVVGCSRVSPGCEHCYAAAMDKRIRGKNREEWRDWTAPNAAYNVRLHPERLDAPLRWRKPRRIFVNSMSDLFHEQVPDAFIDRVFAVMALTPQHTYQVLTKRPERMREYVDDRPAVCERIWNAMEEWPAAREWRINEAVREALANPAETARKVLDQPDDGYAWPLPNVWLGVSAEDQRRADERIPLLLETPAAVRFVSAEPLLGRVDLRRGIYLDAGTTPRGTSLDGIDWVIVGGESGPGARPCDVGWIRDIVTQCQAAGVRAFVKQLGARPVGLPLADSWRGPVRPEVRLCDRKGGDPAEWPADLRIRQFPGEVTL